MIRDLRVTNLALIQDVSVEFGQGLNVFTGETGAGKSILMGAIGLLLGERAYSDQVRAGEEEAEVNGVFEIDSNRPALAALLTSEHIPFENGEIIIRRRIQRNGRNRVYVNQVPVPLSLLKQIGDLLVDLHGQHDHQSLLNPDGARLLIDTIPSVVPYARAYEDAYERFSAVGAALREHDARARELAERRDVIEFQLKELTSLNLDVGEEEKLEQQLSLLSSATDRAEHASAVAGILSSDGHGLTDAFGALRKHLQALARLDEAAGPWLDDLENAQGFVSELRTFAESYVERVQERADPSQVEHINDRLARIQRLRKKYNCTSDQLVERREGLSADLAVLENAESDRGEIEKQFDQAHRACAHAAQKLSTARRKAAGSFDGQVTTQMAGLGFTGGAWRTEFASTDSPGPHGTEDILLTVRTNPGEPFLPLARTASGGEISRLMLAIKTILAERDRVPVLVFDEIDTGIGGTVASEVASCLHGLSCTHQVLCISHLHQIAACADQHYRVQKQTISGRNQTEVSCLDESERVEEIARMLGGGTDATRRHARELLQSMAHPQTP